MKASSILLVAALAFASGRWADAQPQRPAPAPATCMPEGAVSYICGAPLVEDLLPVDGGKQIVGSSFRAGATTLYLIDPVAKTAKPVEMRLGRAEAPYDKCPGPPDTRRYQTHGLDVRAEKGGTLLVYAVSHGGREAIEIYRLTAAKNLAEWVGCVVAPTGIGLNSVTVLPDKSLVATKFTGQAPGQSITDALAGKPTGAAFHWTPAKGWIEVSNSRLPGDNGIVSSPDGKTLFINASGSRQVWRLPLSGAGKPEHVTLDFHPDNLRWAPDGSIFVTGQSRSDETAPPFDADGWSVARLNPKTMSVTPLLHFAATPAYGYATSTAQVGGALFIGTYKSDRIAWLPVPKTVKAAPTP